MMALKKKRLTRFLAAGSSAALLEYGSFILLNMIGLKVLYANTISFCLGLIVSFTLNKKWVFGSQGKIGKQFTAYLMLAMMNLFISNGLIWVLVHKLTLLAFAAKLLVMVTIAAWNYVIFSRLIFRGEKK